MKKIFFFSLTFALAFSNCTFGQPTITLMPAGYSRAVNAEKAKGLDGSPYLFEDWRPGIMDLKNGKTIKGLTYRYNVYKNEVHYFFENKEYAIGVPDSIKELNLDGKRFIFSQMEKNKSIERSYFEVASEGKATLLVKYYIEIIPANYNVALDTGSPNDRITVREQYCLKLGDQITTIDKKGKLLLTLLNDKNTELAEFIEKEDISLKKKDGLIKAVNYYNSL